MKDETITYFTDIDTTSAGERIIATIYVPGAGWRFVLRYGTDGSPLVMPVFMHISHALHPSKDTLLSVSGLAALDAWYNFALENLSDRVRPDAFNFAMRHYESARALYNWLHETGESES